MKNIKSPKLLLAIISFTFLAACSPTEKVVKAPAEEKQNTSSAAEVKAYPVAWHQNAAEYKALCYQAFNTAKMHVKEMVDGSAGYDTDFTGIIMDLDETVLDNSPYNAYLAVNNKEHSEELWNEWVNLAQAELVPGARDFIEYALTNQMKIYYISNRKESMRQATIQNLLERNVPVEEENIFLAPPTNSEKSERRKYVESLVHVFLYIGDNLADFSDGYEMDLEGNQREEITNQFKDEFGRRYIILPNMMYGDWKRKMEQGGGNLMQQVKPFK